MNYSIQPTGYVEKLELNHANQNKVIIHDSDVQDIINMMQEDLQLEKFKSQKDENQSNDSDNPAVNRSQSSVYSVERDKFCKENSLEEMSLNEIDSNTINNNSNSNSNSSAIRDDYNENNYCELNEPKVSLNEEKLDKTSENEIYIKEEDKDNYLFDLETYEDKKKVREEGEDEGKDQDKNLIDFIEKAKDFNANALDLSRKNIFKIPRKLLELNILQYIYLEGNNLIKLPNEFFETFDQLRWLDLRNNQLEVLPSKGLENLECLRCLLLENNKLECLPDELANLRGLTALNLSENPLVYPPIEVVNKGLKQVMIYMKKEQLKKSNLNVENMTDQDIEDYFYQITTLQNEDDVWASDSEEYTSSNLNRCKSGSKYSTSEISLNNYFKNCNARLDTATKNLLTTKSVAPSGQIDPNLALKERINNARINANMLSNKLLNKRKALPPVEVSVYKNEQFEKAIQSGKLEAYKKNKEKIDAKLQKVNDHIIADEFKTKLKAQQRKNQFKRLIKGVDYIEPALKAPYDISENHLIVMTNEQREYVDKALEEQLMRPVSPTTLWQLEEERRQRDDDLQARIRDYTNKLLIRRMNKSQNSKVDRIQAVKDLKDLKKIEKELEQRRIELQHNLRSVTGEAIYKETAKLNAKATIKNVLKQMNK